MRGRCKCYFCRQWFRTKDCPKIRVDPTEGPSYYTVGRVCPDCVAVGRPTSTDIIVRLGNKVEYPRS